MPQFWQKVCEAVWAPQFAQVMSGPISISDAS